LILFRNHRSEEGEPLTLELLCVSNVEQNPAAATSVSSTQIFSCGDCSNEGSRLLDSGIFAYVVLGDTTAQEYGKR